MTETFSQPPPAVGELETVAADGRPAGHFDLNYDFDSLTMADSNWLRQLRGEEVDEYWLAVANDLTPIGSVHLNNNGTPYRHIERLPVKAARDKFFEELLGWGNEAHPLHDSYQKFRRLRPAKPIDVFIQTQRVFAQKGIDGGKVIKKNPSTIGMSPEIGDHLDVLAARGLAVAKILESGGRLLNLSLSNIDSKQSSLDNRGINSVKVFNAFPQAANLAANTIDKRLERLERIAKRLGWQVSVSALVEAYPLLLAHSQRKLLMHARILAQHGHPLMTIEEVRAFTQNSPEASILAIVDGRGGYETRSVWSVSRSMPAQERREAAHQSLKKRSVRRILGTKTVKAYRRYVSGSNTAVPSV